MSKKFGPITDFFRHLNWSVWLRMYRLATYDGVEIMVHWSVFLLIALFAAFSPLQGIGLIICFLSLIPHEFGHIYAARYYGIACRRILVLPIGGVALLEGPLKEPKQELVVTACGPLVTLLLALLAFPLMFIWPSFMTFALFGINLFLLIFNCLPILPSDGGRFLRAGLAMWLPHHQATLYAVYISQGISLTLMGVGILFFQPFLVLTMMALFMMSQHELKQSAQDRS